MGSCMLGVRVGVAGGTVAVAVGDGVAVGVRVGVDVAVARTVAVAVAVAVAVGTPPPRALLARKVMPAISATTAAIPNPSLESTRRLRILLHSRNGLGRGFPTSRVVSISEGAMCSAFTCVGNGSSNSAWCISAMLWNR